MRKYWMALFLLLITLPTQALNIALVLWRGETAAEQGLLDELQRLGHTPVATKFHAIQDRGSLATMLRKNLFHNLVNFDYIYSFGTSTTLLVKTLNNGRKPLIFNVVPFPTDSGVLSGNPQLNKNITGVSNGASFALQLENAHKRLGKLKDILMPFNPRESDAEITARQLQIAANKYNVKIIPWRINPDETLLANELVRLKQAAQGRDVYLPDDSYLQSLAPDVLAALNAARIRTICGGPEYVEFDCTVATYIDYYKLGVLAARQIDKNLKGTPLEKIPYQTDNNPKTQSRKPS